MEAPAAAVNCGAIPSEKFIPSKFPASTWKARLDRRLCTRLHNW